MQLVENQIFFPLTTGTIQMVPGRTGYEPAEQNTGSGNADAYYASRNTRYQPPRVLDETQEITYNRNRRLTSSPESGMGSLIDLYA